MKNIVVIFGSRSTEHDISILTALQVIGAADKNKYNIVPIYISQTGKWFSGKALLDTKFYSKPNYKKLTEVAILPCDNFLYIKKFGKYKKYLKVDSAIISCHGKNGEDGTVQGLFELAQIPYTSGGVLASSVGLDKQKMKEIFVANKIPVCDYKVVNKAGFESEKLDLKDINFPVIVKPNSLGSSIGISVCNDAEELYEALKLVFCFDDVALVEKYIKNLKEVNISVLGDKNDMICSVTEQPVSNGILSFEKKYLSNSTKQVNVSKTNKTVGTKNGMQSMGRIIPADITKKQESTIKNLAKKIFAVTKSKGVVRIDFIIDTDTQKVYANEINTIPGSFAFYLWEKSGISFSKLIDRLIEIAENSKKESNKLTTSFMSSVLSGTNINLQKWQKCHFM